MIRLIEALNFRCLQYVSQPLRPFQLLVGPNATGKTTFLDVVAFLGGLVSDGVEVAVKERTDSFQDLVWGRSGKGFELAIEVAIPENRTVKLKKPFDTARYEVKIGQDADEHAVGILEERVLLKTWAPPARRQRQLFPEEPPVQGVLSRPRKGHTRTVVSKVAGGNDNFYSEVQEESGKGWFPSIRLGPLKSALATLPEDETLFPVSTWLKEFLVRGVQNLVLNSLLMRRASPPGQGRGFKPDGSNLPWVIKELEGDETRLREWVAHLRTALPDLDTIRTVDREDDKHRYLVLHYRQGLKVPSWMASDGTLRLLALTLPGYLPNLRGVFLIEEPENGIHPKAVEAVFQSLSSVYDAQVLLATHSPVLLSLADPGQVLCFQKTLSGATDIVAGDEHPALRDWKGQPGLSVLFASGVLG